jgi:excisionase family DNA binding protein
MENLFTINELTKILKASRRSIAYWIASGKLKGTKVGVRLVRVRESDLEKFLKGGAK